MSIVKEAAEAYGWDELQTRLGVSRQCIWNWQKGKRAPGSDVVMKCLHLLSLLEKKLETKCTNDTKKQLEQSPSCLEETFS